MSYEQIKDAMLSLNERDQKRLILDVVPEIWAEACRDESCAAKLKGLVDADMVRPEQEMHLWGI